MAFEAVEFYLNRGNALIMAWGQNGEFPSGLSLVCGWECISIPGARRSTVAAPSRSAVRIRPEHQKDLSTLSVIRETPTLPLHPPPIAKRDRPSQEAMNPRCDTKLGSQRPQPKSGSASICSLSNHFLVCQLGELNEIIWGISFWLS